MNNFWLKIAKVVALLGDVAIFYFCLYFTTFLRYKDNLSPEVWQLHWPIFTGLLIIWLAVFYAFNLYDLPAIKRKINFFNNFSLAIIINLIVGIIYFYVLSSNTEIRPRLVLLILTVLFSAFYIIWRILLGKIINSKKLYQNLLFVGYHPVINELLPGQGYHQRFGYNFKGIVLENPNFEIGLKKYAPDELENVFKSQKIDLLVIYEPEKKEISQLLFKIMPLKANFISLTNFYERELRRVPLKLINHGWFLENFSEGNKTVLDFIKRIFDLLISVILGIISLVFIPFIALAIKLDSNGPVIFKQTRVGRDGQTFTAYKFRSMFTNAEQTGPSWAKQDDPRVTKIGRFIRKTRLDEIPQLWNILKGQMSFVGPRPERPEFIKELKEQIPFYEERLLIKPGLTGWAQINYIYADSVESSLTKLQYDLYYIKHRSFIFDLGIILKTLNTIIKKLGR
jgi:exopolysaccharide biosynthesis polyprenyl glycosylphosphotransferase